MKEALLESLRGISWHGVLTALADIGIVYYLIYRSLLVIKGTRAAQMLIGVVLIGASFFVAKHFELATLSWLLDRFINYFIIIIIVVFQHDIRRGLMRIGSNLFAGPRRYEETHVFEEVLRAASAMARDRVGAIMVLEREAELAEFIEGGVPLDARVSQELLVSLFLPDSANVLHDGAAVIKSLRVQQAGALLPLSVNPHLDRALGTRHRAAIGITEETDAVAVVVSEERGTVSLCFHGNILRDLDEANLRKTLLRLFFKEKRRRARGGRVAPRGTTGAARGEGRSEGRGEGRTDGRAGGRATDERRVRTAGAAGIRPDAPAGDAQGSDTFFVDATAGGSGTAVATAAGARAGIGASADTPGSPDAEES